MPFVRCGGRAGGQALALTPTTPELAEHRLRPRSDARQLGEQSKLWDTVDARLRVILGLIGIIFAVAAAFQRASPSAQVPTLVGSSAIVAIVLYIVAAALAAVAYWPTSFNRPPDRAQLREAYLLTSPNETRLEVVDTILVAYTANRAIIDRKNRFFKIAFSLTAVATGLLGLALVVGIACQTSAPDWPWWPFPRHGC